MLTAIKIKMAVFECNGVRGRLLELVYYYLQSTPPPSTSVEAERALSAAGLLCTKIRSRLSDATLDTCASWAAIIASAIVAALTLLSNSRFWIARVGAEARHPHHLSWRQLRNLLDCRWHWHTGWKKRSADGEIFQETCSRQQLRTAQPTPW